MTEVLTENGAVELITPERQEILDLPILELSRGLRSGDLDPLDVLHAYWVVRPASCVTVRVPSLSVRIKTF